jgi:hypothetical protein
MTSNNTTSRKAATMTSTIETTRPMTDVDYRCAAKMKQAFDNGTTVDETKVCGQWAAYEIEAAFESVQNPDDWREPIDGTCDPVDAAIVYRAIEFYTATAATFEFNPITGMFRVKAVGYRRGPAGP